MLTLKQRILKEMSSNKKSEYSNLSRNPQNVNSWVWYYEEKKGFFFVVKGQDNKVVEFILPLKMIHKSLERY